MRFFALHLKLELGFPGGTGGKDLVANIGDIRDLGLMCRLRRSSGGASLQGREGRSRALWHRELSFVLCAVLEEWDGGKKEAQDGGDLCVHIADSRCTPGTNTTL